MPEPPPPPQKLLKQPTLPKQPEKHKKPKKPKKPKKLKQLKQLKKPKQPKLRPPPPPATCLRASSLRPILLNKRPRTTTIPSRREGQKDDDETETAGQTGQYINLRSAAEFAYCIVTIHTKPIYLFSEANFHRKSCTAQRDIRRSLDQVRLKLEGQLAVKQSLRL